jgi:hypothetical protein
MLVFDVFLLLTPFLMLAVFALSGFGCGRIGFNPPPPPKGLTATALCGWVELRWDAVADSPLYELVRVADGSEQLIYEGPATTYKDTWILETPAWTAPSYKVRVKFPPHLYGTYSALVSPTRMPHAFVKLPPTQINPRSDYSAFFGMEIQISKPLTICALGRFLLSGNGTNANPDEYCEHPMIIVDAVRDTVVGAAVVVTKPGANINNELRDPNEGFDYAQLIPEVQIFPDDVNTQGAFYIVSQERDMTGMANPEAWCDSTAVIGTPDAVIVGSVYGNIGGWVRVQNGSYSYGPVNFLYNVSSIIQ